MLDRQQYLQLRNNQGEATICYEYYKEHFDKEKHKKFLVFEEFIHYIQQWQFYGGLSVEAVVQTCTNYYDALFNVFKIPLKDKVIYE